MVDIDIEMSNDYHEPRVIIHCNYDHREEAEELRTKIKKAMEVFDAKTKMS